MVLKSYEAIKRADVNKIVSVPLRGCGFEIDQKCKHLHHPQRVSVPLRGCGFEMICLAELMARMPKGFPSPCGDVVLKWDISTRDGNITKIVSVPLRGCGFEMRQVVLLSPQLLSVSVPLRGCGFEILASGSLVPRGSKQHFAARIGFPSVLLRQSVLKATASGMALSAARFSPIV